MILPVAARWHDVTENETKWKVKKSSTLLIGINRFLDSTVFDLRMKLLFTDYIRTVTVRTCLKLKCFQMTHLFHQRLERDYSDSRRSKYQRVSHLPPEGLSIQFQAYGRM